MNKVIGLMLVLSCLSFNTQAQSHAFGVEQFAKLKTQYQGQRWLVLLWSVDCPPCFKELAMIGQMKKQNPLLPVILINTDDDDAVAPSRQELIEKYQLSGLTHLHFIHGRGAQGRYAIDPSWYGELPRSYFYDAAGGRTAKSGLVNNETLKKWLL